MNTRIISASFLGTNTVRSMYLGGTQVWPYIPPRAPQYRNYVNGFSGGVDSIQYVCDGENITGFQSLNALAPGGIVNYTKTGSWQSSSPYEWIDSAWLDHRNTAYYDEQVTRIRANCMRNNGSVRTMSFPSCSVIDNGAMTQCPVLIEINIPSCVTFSNTIVDNLLANNGTLTVRSAVTASAGWNASYTIFQSKAWTINYVNG